MRAPDDPITPRLAVVRGGAPPTRHVAGAQCRALLRDALLYPRARRLPSQRWANLSADRTSPVGPLPELLIDAVEHGEAPDALCDRVVDGVNALRPVLRAHAATIWRPAA